MRVLNDYKCPEGHTTEHFEDPSVLTLPCPECGKESSKLIPMPRASLEGITGSFPGAHASWEKKREQKMAQERKCMERHGTYT